MASHKIKRLASDITRYLSNILLTETRDEIMRSITITGCTVTNDLSYANIFFTSLLDMTHEDLEKELNEASHFLRGKLAHYLEVRHIPNLRFSYDKSIEYGNNIEKIIEKIHEG